jgi:PAS domain S-box-containing protein
MITADVSYSELRYRRLFESARDGILIVDPATRKIIEVNPFLADLLGYTCKELIGTELFEIGLLKDEAASQAAFRELRATGYIRYDDLPLETKSGRRVNVEFVSNLYQEGDRQIIQCNVRDISARKQADTALRQSEERFKLVARAVSNVIWDWNLVTDKLWWSDGFSATFGYAANEIEPGLESWTSRIHPDELRRVVDGRHRAVDTGAESWAADYRFRREDGSYAFVQDLGYILRDATGKGIRMVGGMRDLTEEKKREAQQLRAQRMESIGTLAGGIAHDLNNVLTPIMMSIELLTLDAGNDPNRRKILDTIQSSCQRGAALLHQVLAFARGVDGQRVGIRLRDLIDDLKGMIGETFPRNITIVTDVPNELWPITGDPSQLHQVLLNLTINARDAMPDGGTLTVAASNTTLDAHGTDTGGKAGRYLLLQVTDTGRGIPLEIRERIFEPFFTTKEVGKGTGLGLATVHAIVKSHDGFVTVESEVGLGTTFKIYLPANPAQPTAETVQPLPADLRRGRDELVLVVDDEPSIRDITKQTLEAFGYRVITAGDGAEAVELYAKQAQQVAVVLIDGMMPVMDGPTAIQALTRINPAVRVISASGLGVAEEVVKATGRVVKDTLPKPYAAETLLRRIREVLDRPASELG